ncbi:MAG: glucose-6-phosphate isomerase [Candidatus Abyssobacteria bacterium SURF_17]|uniref:Glucose-6-phosphate isomerase n=1 Tax=Candidatus Abyssobacteria bacterium SURF_17 TaxID=2093361 RepID=A0A419EWW1_9BACT|nr:MAG: glucose-6-phosphate isomerase [Candidatus Abyssubacteria bacterium SURF_17]
MPTKDAAELDRIVLDYTNVMADAIGSEHGIVHGELSSELSRVKEISRSLKKQRADGKLAFMDLPHQKGWVREIEGYVRRMPKTIENFVVIGIGGSALGNIMLHSALNHSEYNLLSRERRKGRPRMFFLDNVDPDRTASLLEALDPRKTVFNVITKSGDTAETMSNFLVARQWLLRSVGKKALARHIVATTDAKKGHLRKLVEKEGYESFVVPDGVGGRFSVLTPVGLVSAAVSGINIRKLLAGGAKMDEICQTDSPTENPAALNALLHYLLDTRKGKKISVMMPYVQRLRDFADWYRQLWAESLGKKYSLDGKEVYTGQTPVKALGATDQHSQIQLYMEGPFDKVVTFIGLKRYPREVTIPRAFTDMEGISYLGGRQLGELLKAEQESTALALAKNQRPNCTVTLPRLDAFVLGQMIYLYEVQTAFAGALYGVNPFDQPGVELGKHYACGTMGRKGYEQYRDEVDRGLSKGMRMTV